MQEICGICTYRSTLGQNTAMHDADESPAPVLSVQDHSRDAAGLTYVYPVVSRRAGGVSIGINLNTNNACNWACSYCQVPDLVRGGPPPVDLAQLHTELDRFLQEVLAGDFMRDRVPEALRKLRDLAFSGNGEPTASAEFPSAVKVVLQLLARHDPAQALKLVVISNGSHVQEPAVQQALVALAGRRGELWFKLDRGNAPGRRRVNGIDLPDALILRRLAAAAKCIPVWLQTCVFACDGNAPDADERAALVALVARAQAMGVPLQGVLLYTLARPSLQPGGERLAALSPEEMEAWAEPLRGLGLEVRLSA